MMVCCANMVMWCVMCGFNSADDDSNWLLLYHWFHIFIVHIINRYVWNSPKLSIGVSAHWRCSHSRSLFHSLSRTLFSIPQVKCFVIHSEAHLTKSGVIMKSNWNTDLQSKEKKKTFNVMRPNENTIFRWAIGSIAL